MADCDVVVKALLTSGVVGSGVGDDNARDLSDSGICVGRMCVCEYVEADGMVVGMLG